MLAKNIDFYSVNNDFSGERTMADEKHELVEHLESCAIRIWYNTQNTCFDTHWHNDIEIIMPVENWYDAVVDEQYFHVEPGDIIIIPSGALHSLTAPDTGMRFVFLLDIASIASIHGFAEVEARLSSPLHVTKSAFPYVYDDIHSILMQIRDEYFCKKPFYELTIFSLLLNMFVTIGRNHLNNIEAFSNTRIYKQQEYADKFNNVLEYIDEHYMEDFTLEDIAAAVGFSKYHFSRLFKQYTGFTFCSYICHCRIKVAEKLLAQPDLSITEIAMKAGFPSISTFNRVFRQQKNCSPTEYRDKNNRLRHFYGD